MHTGGRWQGCCHLLPNPGRPVPGSTCYAHVQVSTQEPTWIHLDRIIGGHRHYRNPGSVAPAGPKQSQAPRAGGLLHEQFEAAHAGLAVVFGRQQRCPALVLRREPHDPALCLVRAVRVSLGHLPDVPDDRGNWDCTNTIAEEPLVAVLREGGGDMALPGGHDLRNHSR